MSSLGMCRQCQGRLGYLSSTIACTRCGLPLANQPAPQTIRRTAPPSGLILGAGGAVLPGVSLSESGDGASQATIYVPHPEYAAKQTPSEQDIANSYLNAYKLRQTPGKVGTADPNGELGRILSQTPGIAAPLPPVATETARQDAPAGEATAEATVAPDAVAGTSGGTGNEQQRLGEAMAPSRRGRRSFA